MSANDPKRTCCSRRTVHFAIVGRSGPSICYFRRKLESGYAPRLFAATLIASIFAVALMQVASAADLPRKAPAYSPPPPLANWTGFYVGLNAGYSWSCLNNTLLTTNGTPGYFGLPPIIVVIPGVNASGTGGLDDSSFTGGLQLGYNIQSGQFVYGIEGDINWLRHEPSFGGTFLYSNGAGTYNLTVSSSIDWLATIRGRLAWPSGPRAILSSM